MTAWAAHWRPSASTAARAGRTSSTARKRKFKAGLDVTADGNIPAHSPQRIFDLYRSKDGVEKRFHVSKSDLKVSPIYLHKDVRIEMCGK